MSDFGSLTGISSSSSSIGAISHNKEKDLQDTTGIAARNDNPFSASNIDLQKGQIPEGCRELGWG